MERLLADASKLEGAMGKTFDINNLGDVYEAIHLIQDDLGLTGVAADEAATTFTGSFGAMKAAATNLMAAITSGEIDNIYEYIVQLFSAAETFVFKNLAPMIGRILQKLPQLLSNVMFEVGVLLSDAAESTDMAGEFIGEFIVRLVECISQSLPGLVKGLIDFASSVIKSLISYDWIGLIQQLVKGFVSYIDEGFYEIGFEDKEGFISAFKNWILNTLPLIFEQGIDIILELVNGIIDNLPLLVETAAPMIASFTAGIAEHLPEIIEKGFELITKLIVGLIQAIPKLIAALPEIFKAIKDAFDDYDWKTLGINILEGIGKGIISAVSAVVQAARDAAAEIFNAVKDFFDIGSPSKLMANEIGKWIPAGVAVGIEGNMDSLNAAVGQMNKEMFGTSLDARDYSYKPNSIASSGSSEVSELAKAIKANPTNVTVTLEGDARRLFKAMQAESKNYNSLTGRNAFA